MFDKTTKMKKVLKLGIGVMIVMLVLNVYFGAICTRPQTHAQITDKTLSELDLTACENLMIVAHPDDETLWGGRELIETGNYLVVCMTYGKSKTRGVDFCENMKEIHNTPLMLNYPDKMFYKRSNWGKYQTEILKDIEKVLTAKRWNKIVTHNPDGEYGHQHHKFLNAMVTSECQNKGWLNELYYFGKYYNKYQIEGLEITTSGDTLIKKIKLINRYDSNLHYLGRKFEHMYQYDSIVKYADWNK